MHVLIGLLTAIASLLYALDRLGVDIGWLNPWAWARRRRWRKQLSVNPAFNLNTPMEAVALLLVATARIDGDLSAEEKAELKRLFEDSFKLNSRDVSSLMSSSTFLLGSGDEVFQRPEEVLARSLDRFSPEQKDSSLEMLNTISGVGGTPSQAQQDFIARIRGSLFTEVAAQGWQ
ncbi:TerB family tellurite resistance protein [Mangrovimicrobium sediminis]|uniref:TerB family tellurite resistance protein n=1 Tax=Mangrovimicrobium sediminis TaxID=2562682 RepID=A0A4Z0M9B6_9GAMM|nr:TerB family tellurite resistance protein [Haliea sp. SAOS-164]TGD76121.1 TerB family tellurite resistance protein [Haliea sp. SAOS-164]